MKNSVTRRRFAGIAAAITLMLPMAIGAAKAAGDYPDRPVTLVIPYKAGGSTETMARIYSVALAKELGQRVIVKTRPGGGGAVGATEVAAAAADGYTLLFAASQSLLWPPLTQEVEFDLDSFRYVGQITEYQQAIVARADAPFDTLQELIEHARTKSLNYADQSAMSRTYINFIGAAEGVQWTVIPTKGGGEMVPFLLGGKIDFAWSGGIHNRYPEKMKVLASMNAGPLDASPDVASISGKYGVSMPSQAVIVVPSATPDEVVAKIESAMAAAVGDPDFIDLLENKLKFPVTYLGAAEISKSIAATTAGLKSVIDKTR